MSEPLHPPRGALHAPHTLRNRDPILAVLRRCLADTRAVLEIGCGPGEQAPYFAAAMAHLEWLPADLDPTAVASAEAWRAASAVANVRAPIRIDVAADDWPLPNGFAPDAIVAINMIHIAPFSACKGLMAGAGRVLPAGGTLYLYGPFRIKGAHTAPSNAMFDQNLRSRDPAWGIRDLETVIDLARQGGLQHAETVPMPANNLSVIFRKA